MPYNVLRYENGIPVYRREDVDLYGQPDYYGLSDYLVVCTLDDIAPRKMDWKEEQDRKGSLRPPHRYCRMARFKALLRDMVGGKDIPQEALDLIKDFNGFEDGLAERVRDRFKKSGFQKFYNSIPMIVKRLKGEPIDFDWRVIEICEQDFKAMSYKFDFEYQGRRKYFPNLRYVALTLFELNGFDYGLEIKKVRTPRKVKVLEDIFDCLY